MARRGHGDGSLYQRSNGLWVGRVELPPKDGKRRQKYVTSMDRNEAIRKLRALRRDVEEGRIAVTSSATVEQWLTRWLDDIARPRLRPTTHSDYTSVISRHIIPAIGSRRLHQLAPDHIRAMHRAIGPSRTAELAHVVLSKALKDAMREGMITHNVCERVDKPRYTRQRRTSMSPGVARLVIRTALETRDPTEATRWVAAFVTGARQGELLGMRWQYIDLDAGYADISWQLQQLRKTHGCGDQLRGGDWPCGRQRVGYCPQARWDLPPGFEWEPCHRSLVFTRPKTAAGTRVVPLIGPLLAALRELHDRQGVNPHDLVWHRPDGRPIDPRADNRAWNQLLVDAEVIEPGQTMPLHLVRHTTATLLRSAGVDEQTRMEILGHVSVDAQRGYAHADRSRHLAAMGTLGELLG